jgi:hypothetical protein
MPVVSMSTESSGYEKGVDQKRDIGIRNIRPREKAI